LGNNAIGSINAARFVRLFSRHRRPDNNPGARTTAVPCCCGWAPFGGRHGQRRRVNSSRSSDRHGHTDAQSNLRARHITVALEAPDPRQRAEAHEGNGFPLSQERRCDQPWPSCRCGLPGPNRECYSADSVARAARRPRLPLRMLRTAYPTAPWSCGTQWASVTHASRCESRHHGCAQVPQLKQAYLFWPKPAV